MPGRRSRRPDPDDWFAETETAAPPPPSRDVPPQQTVEEPEDWLAVERPARRPGPAWPLTQVQTVAVAGAAAFVLLLGLWIGGAFSGAKKHPPAPPTTAPTTTATTPTISTTPSLKPPTTTLKPGDTGAQVRTLQRALARLGYSVGTIDGTYGPATQTAVESFQRAQGLTVDGILGSQTLSALTTALTQAG